MLVTVISDMNTVSESKIGVLSVFNLGFLRHSVHFVLMLTD